MRRKPKAIHLAGKNGRTMCGRLPTEQAVQILTPNRCVDDATCKACHRADTRQMLEAHRVSVGEGALARVLRELPEADRQQVADSKTEDFWRRLAITVAARADFEEDVQRELADRIGAWLHGAPSGQVVAA